MPDCEEALELISAKIDGALTQEEEAALAAHLERCPACRALLTDLEALHRDMEGAMPPVPPPSGLQEEIMARIRGEQPARARSGLRWRTWAAMAAVLAVVLLGTGTLRSWQDGGSGAVTADWAANGSALPPSAPSQGESAGTESSALPAGGRESQPYDDGSDLADAGGSGVAGGSGGTGSDAAPSQEHEYASAQGGGDQAGGSKDPSSDMTVEQTDPPAQTPVPRAQGPQPSQALQTGGGAAPSPLPSFPGMTYTAVEPTGLTVYRGVLTLTWDQAEGLSALEGLSYTLQGDTRSYLLPAADFEALIQSLGAAGTDALRQEGSDISPDAGQGLVLVTGAPQS